MEEIHIHINFQLGSILLEISGHTQAILFSLTFHISLCQIGGFKFSVPVAKSSEPLAPKDTPVLPLVNAGS